jgi:NADPH-dependent 2,4-dienoyl-CoA reductase/sulfur reductase-like enzyme
VTASSDSRPARIVVVGASLAGLRAVESLRQLGHEGTIVAIGAEPHRSYDRPPLSKQVLAGEWEADATALRKDDDDSLDVDWRLGCRARSLDTGTRTVTLDDGETVPYDGLVIATGATPRRLPGAEGINGVHVLRTLDDCLALRAELERGPKVVVVGAGFIGAEVAATCRGRRLDVTMLEALPVPLERALGARMGTVCAGLHREHGVDLRLSTGVDGFVAGGGGRIAQVRLTDGGAVDADVVVVGIGVAPETSWLDGSGVTVNNGVVCDETLAASAPGVVAAGDVCRWPNPLFGVQMRLEHWTNAAEQGLAAARRLLGFAEPFAPVPYFWSDQYDRKFQFVGIADPDDDVEVVEGATADYQFIALYGRAGRLVGALALNRPRPLMQYRRMIADQSSFADALALAAQRR